MLSEQNGGCDLQVRVEKMGRIAPRFLHPTEQQHVLQFDADAQTDLQHLFWTMKEALYKTYSFKELDFKEHIHVGPFDWDGFEGTCTGYIRKGDFTRSYQLTFGKYVPPEPDFDRLPPMVSLPLPPLYWTVCSEE